MSGVVPDVALSITSSACKTFLNRGRPCSVVAARGDFFFCLNHHLLDKIVPSYDILL